MVGRQTRRKLRSRDSYGDLAYARGVKRYIDSFIWNISAVINTLEPTVDPEKKKKKHLTFTL
jgi:hypothetical protein